jgi:hypothetical protein
MKELTVLDYISKFGKHTTGHNMGKAWLNLLSQALSYLLIT